MNRANQQALFQQTNQGLLGIRQSEVNYYQNLNVAFGTQAALIGGFTYGVFTQNEVNYSNNYETEDYIADLYWILSATTIAMAVHVILCTMLMQVLGPGLALHGPVGSMARATEGMRLEQKQIITSFVAMMIMFSLSTVLSCWVVMSMEGAVGCSVAFFVAACYWYKYCERIYLRFYWNPEESGWNTGESTDDLKERNPTAEDEPIHMPVPKEGLSNTYATPRAPIRRKWFTGIFTRKRSSFSAGARQSKEGNRIRLGSSGSTHSANTAVVRNRILSSDSQHGGSVQTQHWAAVSVTRGVLMEGYLTKLGGGSTSPKLIDFRKEPWERRYFTLSNTANLFIYQNRHEYRNDPKNPIFTRPLRLSEYYIEVSNSDNFLKPLQLEPIDERERSSTLSTNDNDIPTMDDSPIRPCLFQMTLILRENVHDELLNGAEVIERGSPGAAKRHRYRDHWVLRCDTEEELQQWVGVIRDICPSCFKKF